MYVYGCTFYAYNANTEFKTFLCLHVIHEYTHTHTHSKEEGFLIRTTRMDEKTCVKNSLQLRAAAGAGGDDKFLDSSSIIQKNPRTPHSVIENRAPQPLSTEMES